MLDIDTDGDYQLTFRQILYGFKQKQFSTSLKQWLAFCHSQGCKLYFGVEKMSSTEVRASVIAVNELAGYNHVMFVKIPFNVIDNKKGVIEAQVHTYVPMHNVTSLFGSYKKNKKKKFKIDTEIICILICVLASLVMIAQDKSVSLINKIKLDSTYIYGEVTHKTCEEASSQARELLKRSIKEWIEVKTKAPCTMTLNPLVVLADSIVTKRANMIRYFLYIKKFNELANYEAKFIQAYNLQAQMMFFTGNKIGPGSKCFCSSGKRFEQCHMNHISELL